MPLKRPAAGLTFCLLYLTSYFTNKYVLSVLKFTYPTLFQGWQTLVGGLLLHIFWKWGWVEISSSSRTEVISWLPASALFVGIIYSGSRALSRLPIPIFLTLHNAAEVITCGIEKFVQKEQISLLKICRVLILLVAAGCLPFCDPQFDADGYFWAVTHLLCVGAYKVFHKLWRPSSLSDSEQQYINYASSVVVLAFASHPTGDLFSALDFPFLYFYSFHSSCCASGLLGFLLTLHTINLKSSTSSGQCTAWNCLAKNLFWDHRKCIPKKGVEKMEAKQPTTVLQIETSGFVRENCQCLVITAALSPIIFEITVNVSTTCCLFLGGFAEVLLVYAEWTGS